MIIKDLNSLCEKTGLSVDLLENMTLKEIQSILKQKEVEEQKEQKEKKLADDRFLYLVKTYFTPYAYLQRWFSEPEINDACAEFLTERDLVQEMKIKTDCRTPPKACPHGMEYVKTDYAYVQQYTKGGEPLLNQKRALCHIYITSNKYQHLRHGNVIKKLLYGRYPQLEPFDFEFYGVWNPDYYELYPKNHIYVPFKALMEKDTDAIWDRNVSYWKSYNGTEKDAIARMESEEGQFMLQTIRNL